jgi:transposase-like protein
MMRKAVESRRWSMTLPLKKKRKRRGRRQMEKTEKRKGTGHTAEEKCRAVLSVWTERRKPREVCQEMGVAWSLLSQWQARAMEGMLLALQPRVPGKRGVALNPRLAVLLKRKSKGGVMKGLGQRLARLQSKTRLCEKSPVIPGELQEIGALKKA